jgi:quinoprotein glucose dehydrogenase
MVQRSKFQVRVLVLVLGAVLVPGALAAPRAPNNRALGEWRAYGADLANTKYSPLDRITRENVRRLRVAWRWRSIDAPILESRPDLHTFLNESTPVMADGVLYTVTSLSQIAAIDPVTGRTIWTHDPKAYEAGQPVNLGFVNRGLAYWRDGETARLFAGTGDGFLVALDARSGRPATGFGERGRIDLTQGLRRPVDRAHYSVTSPPIVCRGVVIVGSSVLDPVVRQRGAPGDVRGFDARTGRLKWTFHTIPEPGEAGADTWEDGSNARTGNANVWTIMSADEALGYVYLPVSTPTSDFYGGQRRGANLYGDSLVAVDAVTGRRVWHFQMVHHGLWDYDPPAAPVLADVTIGGRPRRILAQVTKQGFCFVFDRATGEPIWPIVERRVAASTVDGERAWPTQPFPALPPPFERQGLVEDDLIDFTPELRAEAGQILRRHHHGPLYTPGIEGTTIMLPGWIGGANWSGAGLDPETGLLYVPSITAPFIVTLQDADPEQSDLRFVSRPPLAAEGPRGLPLTKPPYGRVTAIALTDGSRAWMTPVGSGPRDHPALKGLNLPRLGWPSRGAPLVTKTLLFIGQEPRRLHDRNRPSPRGNGVRAFFEPREAKLFVFDKSTGEPIAEIDLPTNATGAPMTYLADGRQFIVVPVGGANLPAELVALSVP